MENRNNPRSKYYDSPGNAPGTQEALDRASADLLRKVPPQNLEAEQAVLGGVFQHSHILHSIVDEVDSEDFYSPAHRVIFQCFQDLYRESKPIDVITVAEKLTVDKTLDTVGGPVYLAELADSVVSGANAAYHAKIVRDKSIQRSLIKTASEIIEQSFDTADVDTLLGDAESAIFDISNSKSTQVIRPANDVIQQVLDEMSERAGSDSLITGIPTKYHRLDEMTSGLQPSDLIIIAGRPSMGKTAFALNVAVRAAMHSATPTAVFSLEMSTEQLMQRMMALWAKVELSRMRSGNLEQEDWDKLYGAAQDMSQAPIFIDDTPSLSTLEISARCRRLKSEHDLGLVIVDYLQLMRSSRKRLDSRELEISDISRTLKGLAKQLKVPVIALSQLNRKVEERGDKRPMLSDLRESGAIEQDADVIMMMYRDDYYNKKEDNPKQGLAEVIIGKQRNGPTGSVELTFLKQYTAFENMAVEAYPSEYQSME